MPYIKTNTMDLCTQTTSVCSDVLLYMMVRVHTTKEAILKDQSSWYECEPLGADIAQEQIDMLLPVKDQ